MALLEPGGGRWRTTAFAVWAVIGILLLLGAALWGLSRISAALMPFVLALVIVLGLKKPVDRLEAAGMRRGWAIGFLFLFAAVAITFIVLFIAPPIGRELTAFASAIPDFITRAGAVLADIGARLNDFIFPTWLDEATTSLVRSLSALLVSASDTIATGIVAAGSGIATLVFMMFIAVVIAFWTLKDLPTIKQELLALAGERYSDDLEKLMSTLGRMVGGYLKGQTIASLVTGTAAGVGFALLGVPYALVLGVVTFILNYVPYFGAFAAGLLAATLALVFNGPLVALLSVIVSVAAQNVTDNVVTPRVMSSQVDLHPTLVIFSLLIGGTLFGFAGLLFAIPLAATAKALFVHYYQRNTSRQLTTEDGALFKTPADEQGEEQPERGAADDQS